jgi:hypothetical protein
LDLGSTDIIHIILGWLWLDKEKIAKKVEIGFYPHEGFTKMNKNGDVENRIEIEVMKLKAIIEKEAAKRNQKLGGLTALDKM